MKNEIEKLIEKAEYFLKEAEYLFEGGWLKGTANRCYYSMFTGVQALLFSIEKFSKTHKGSNVLFNEYFIKKNIFDKKYAKMFIDAFDLRQSSDYDSDDNIDESEAKELLETTSEFLQEIKNYLINN